MVIMFPQSHPRQFSHSPLTGFDFTHAFNTDERDLNIFQRRQVIKEVEILENHPYLLAIGVQVSLSMVAYLSAFKPDFSLFGGDEKVDALQ
jgi:hypothetical protein